MLEIQRGVGRGPLVRKAEGVFGNDQTTFYYSVWRNNLEVDRVNTLTVIRHTPLHQPWMIIATSYHHPDASVELL